MLTYGILNVYFQYLKSLLTSFLITTYNILKIYNGSAQLKMVFQRNCLSQEFVLSLIVQTQNDRRDNNNNNKENSTW